jgi:hypothetical protein
MGLSLAAGAHVCHLYDNTREQNEVTLQFLKQALDADEAAIHVAAASEPNDWFLKLQAVGVDVREVHDSRRLRVVDNRDWYFPEELSSIYIGRRLWRTISNALSDFPGVRLVSEMSWTIGTPISPDQLCHWEATKNVVIKDLNVRLLCQFDLQSHSVPELHAALRTHPLVLLDGRLIANPFNEAEEILRREPDFNTPDSDPQRLAQKLAELRALPALA